MPFEIVRNDITKMSVDAIVNAANSALAPGGGVCGAIFAAAGYDQLERACRAIGHCDVGQAVITDGFHLPEPGIQEPALGSDGIGHNLRQLRVPKAHILAGCVRGISSCRTKPVLVLRLPPGQAISAAAAGPPAG